jgi:hypothetical protein
MKYILAILLPFILLTACPKPVDIPTAKAFVVNSAWHTVLAVDVQTGKSVAQSDVQEQVDAYNAANTSDQEFLYLDQVPPIEDAPTANAYIVVERTHVVAEQFIGIQRSDLEARRNSWSLEVELLAGPVGEPCVLYVDNIPAAPVPEAPVPDYVKYAIYIYNTVDGSIQYETHEGVGTFDSMLHSYNLTRDVHNASNPPDPWAVIYGQIYTPPAPSVGG